jgi:hypothetical protein
MHPLLLAAGLIAGLVNLVAFIPYIRDTFLHKTKPERATWWIYSVLYFVLWAAQLGAGAKWLLISTTSYVITSIAIAVLSLKYGYGSLHRRDIVSLAIAALGLLLWKVTNDPLLAILTVIVIDFAGFWLTLFKTWHAPHTETLLAWQLAFVSSVFGLLSVGSMNFRLIAYPLYAIFADALIIWIIMYRRPKVGQDLADV